MDYKKNSNLSTKKKCNMLANFLNPKKRTKSKNSHYSLILNGFMDIRSGEA